MFSANAQTDFESPGNMWDLRCWGQLGPRLGVRSGTIGLVKTLREYVGWGIWRPSDLNMSLAVPNEPFSFKVMVRGFAW